MFDSGHGYTLVHGWRSATPLSWRQGRIVRFPRLVFQDTEDHRTFSPGSLVQVNRLTDLSQIVAEGLRRDPVANVSVIYEHRKG